MRYPSPRNVTILATASVVFAAAVVVLISILDRWTILTSALVVSATITAVCGLMLLAVVPAKGSE